jgi:multiple sugar transport system ATP-binding protein
MAVVKTQNLTKIFKEGELGAVNDVNLETREGEFLVFLGPSGSGKTTLLRMIAGLEHPTAGEILIGGRVVNDLSPRERRIAMVFQSYALYPHLTVYRNIAFPLRAQKSVQLHSDGASGKSLGFVERLRARRKLEKEKVEWAASLLGIGGLLHRKPRELSGGERQRVALARAIVREPTVFLLDEPLSNLDAKLRAAAREELERFHRRVGTTTIYVTHDQVEAMAMGDRVVVLNKGYVRQIGTPKEVYDQPADTFVATFLGSPPMNLIENGEVIVGFRPEQFRPAAQVTDGSKVQFRFRVENVEYLGSEYIVAGVLAVGHVEGKKAIARLGSAQSLELGQTYDFAVAERELKFFDRTSETRVAARALSWQ